MVFNLSFPLTQQRNVLLTDVQLTLENCSQEGKWKALLSDLRKVIFSLERQEAKRIYSHGSHEINLLFEYFFKGADLTSMLIPAEFIRPQSVLERLAFLMQHGRYLENIVAPNLSPVPILSNVFKFLTRDSCCASDVKTMS